MLQIVASNNPATTAVKVTVNTPSSASRRRHDSFVDGTSAWSAAIFQRTGIFWLVICMLVAVFMQSRFRITAGGWKTLRRNVLTTVLALGALGVLASCGGGSGSKQPQNFSVTLTTAAGTTTQAVNFSLTVQ
jgi:hypothetical protein